MKFNNDYVAKQIELALGELSSSKIDIRKKLVENSSDTSLYEYLIKSGNFDEMGPCIYFENNLFKGVFFAGEFTLLFGAENFSNVFSSNRSIRISKNTYGEEKIRTYLNNDGGDVFVKTIGYTYDKPGEEKDKFISYAYSNSEAYRKLSFNIKRPYVDYSVNQKKPHDLSMLESNIFVNNHYYCTSEFAGITECANGVLERIKVLQEADKNKFRYNGDEKELKTEIIHFSAFLIKIFNDIERKIIEAVKQYPIRIVDYDEIKFKDDEEKEKSK